MCYAIPRCRQSRILQDAIMVPRADALEKLGTRNANSALQDRGLVPGTGEIQRAVLGRTLYHLLIAFVSF